MTTTPGTYPTTEQATALALVGRVVTDGTQVGILRMVDARDWVVVCDTTAPRHEWDLSVPPATLLHTAPLPLSFPESAYANVRWNGTDCLTVVPLRSIRRGVTLSKAYGLPRFEAPCCHPQWELCDRH